MFKPGHTVDIQVKVTRRTTGAGQGCGYLGFAELRGHAGRRGQGFSTPRAGLNRPFQASRWSSLAKVVFLEVYDKKNGLFGAPKRFTLSSTNGAADFPLKTGDFQLEANQRQDPPVDPRLTHVVLNSQLVGDLKRSSNEPAQVATDSDRPIVIK